MKVKEVFVVILEHDSFSQEVYKVFENEKDAEEFVENANKEAEDEEVYHFFQMDVE